MIVVRRPARGVLSDALFIEVINREEVENYTELKLLKEISHHFNTCSDPRRFIDRRQRIFLNF